MYNKNDLYRNVLITPEEVVFHGPTKASIEERMIKSSIIIAEERFIRPVLGYALYDAIAAAKNVEITSLNIAAQKTMSSMHDIKEGDVLNAFEYLDTPYKTLWKQHLWKLVAECVITSAYPEGFVQFGTEGTIHNNPPAGLMVTSGAVIPLLTSMKWAIDKKVKDRISPLLASMHVYLCKNISDFSLYKTDCSDCADDEESKQRKFTGLALDIYDDEEDENCCGDGWWK